TTDNGLRAEILNEIRETTFIADQGRVSRGIDRLDRRLDDPDHVRVALGIKLLSDGHGVPLELVGEAQRTRKTGEPDTGFRLRRLDGNRSKAAGFAARLLAAAIHGLGSGDLGLFQRAETLQIIIDLTNFRLKAVEFFLLLVR